jgi:hypothetical protein
MSFKSKTLRIKEKDVTVHCRRVDEHLPTHRFIFSAEIEGKVYDRDIPGLTIGPEDNAFEHITPEQLQKDVDSARQKAAEHAYFHHTVGSLITDVD